MVSLFVATALCLTITLSANGGSLGRLESIASVPVHKSPRGRFVVIGLDNLEALEVLHWATEVSYRFEKRIGIKPSFQQQNIRLVVHKSLSDSAEDAFITVHEDFLDGRLVQSLVFHGYPKVDAESAREGLCRILLNGFVVSLHIQQQRERGGGLGNRVRKVPFWMSEGVAQSLYPDQRARNRDLVVARWENASLPPLVSYFTSESFDREPVCGFIVMWLLSLSDSDKIFVSCFERLAAGEIISPEWLIAQIPECSGVADMEERWENWIISQRKVIYRPGKPTLNAIGHLKQEMLLYPSESGINLSEEKINPVDLRDLIRNRKSEWAVHLARNKSVGLRILAVGRGSDFGAVVASYCKFFNGVVRGKSEKWLEKRLAHAENELAQLEERLSSGSDETPDDRSVRKGVGLRQLTEMPEVKINDD